MNSHRRFVLILGIACLLLGLLSHAAQTKVKRVDRERATHLDERSERGLRAETSAELNDGFNLLTNRLAPTLAVALSRTFAALPQASTTLTDD